MRSFFLMVGLLVGGACADEIAAVADAASDAFSEPDTYVDTSTAEALAELAGVVDTHRERLDAIEQAMEEAAEERLSIRGRIYTLEGAKTTAKADIASLKEADVALGTEITSLTGKTDTLQDDLDALVAVVEDDSCPEGTTAAADVCVETDARPPQLLGSVFEICAADERHLCSLNELQMGCESGVDSSSPAHWTSTAMPDGFLVSTLEPPGCSPNGYSVAPYEGTARPFRCCVAR